jgi:hypothetical protein
LPLSLVDRELIDRYLREIRLLRPPKRLLSTFGTTRIEYHLVSPVEDMPGKTRLREGVVVSEKPAVLAPQTLLERFDGFGDEGRAFAEFIGREYAEFLRAVEYRFRNSGARTTVVGRSLQDTADSIQADLGSRDVAEAAVISCPDPAWSLALMKFTLDEASRSFPTHLRDLERRGFFDPGGPGARRRKAEIERLFSQASADAGARKVLGEKLREYGMFEDYEDRFLSLFS